MRQRPLHGDPAPRWTGARHAPRLSPNEPEPLGPLAARRCHVNSDSPRHGERRWGSRRVRRFHLSCELFLKVSTIDQRLGERGEQAGSPPRLGTAPNGD